MPSLRNSGRLTYDLPHYGRRKTREISSRITRGTCKEIAERRGVPRFHWLQRLRHYPKLARSFGIFDKTRRARSESCCSEASRRNKPGGQCHRECLAQGTLDRTSEMRRVFKGDLGSVSRFRSSSREFGWPSSSSPNDSTRRADLSHLRQYPLPKRDRHGSVASGGTVVRWMPEKFPLLLAWYRPTSPRFNRVAAPPSGTTNGAPRENLHNT